MCEKKASAGREQHTADRHKRTQAIFGTRLSMVLSFVLLLFNSAQSASLQGSEWKPLRIGETGVPAASTAFVQFRGSGHLRGFSGCNRLFAKYQTVDGHILIGPVAATRRICAEKIMALEGRLASALESARSYQRVGIRLVLFDQDGIPVLELRQTDWD